MPYRFREEIFEDGSDQINWWSSLTGNHTDTTFVWKTGSRRCWDNVTPNYHKLIARGVVINNSCVMEVHRHQSDGSGHLSMYRAADDYSYTRSGPVSRESGEGFAHIEKISGLSDEIAKHKLNALSRMDSTPYAFGEDLLELKQTIGFLRNPVTAVANLALSFQRDRRGLVKKGISVAKASSDLWLTYRFAVSPLVRSARNAIDAALIEERPPNERRNSRSKGTISERVVSSPTSSYLGNRTAAYNKVVNNRADVSAQILYEISNPIADFTWKTGLRIKDAPKALWAVMPYSFMIDRLVDISGAVGALTNLLDPKLKILAASTTVKSDQACELTLTDVYRTGESWSGSGETITDDLFRYDRQRWYPSVSDAIPSVELKGLVSSSTNIVDLIALTLQRFRQL